MQTTGTKKNYSREIVRRVSEKFESFIEMSEKRKNDTIFDTQKVNENLISAEVETNFFQTTSKQNSGKVFSTIIEEISRQSHMSKR